MRICNFAESIRKHAEKCPCTLHKECKTAWMSLSFRDVHTIGHYVILSSSFAFTLKSKLWNLGKNLSFLGKDDTKIRLYYDNEKYLPLIWQRYWLWWFVIPSMVACLSRLVCEGHMLVREKSVDQSMFMQCPSLDSSKASKIRHAGL